jgi:hypothetical protein
VTTVVTCLASDFVVLVIESRQPRRSNFLGCDRLGFYRTQIQAGAYGRVAEYDMSAK